MPKSKKFQRLLKATRTYYAGRKVPKKYWKKYGKIYSKEEAGRIAYAIARKQKMKI